MKRILGMTLALTIIVSLFIGTAIALPTPNVTENVADGTTSYFVTTLTGIPAGDEISDGTYPGWCVDTSTGIERGTDHIVTLYSSLAPPASLSNEAWDMVNYILNHRAGGKMDIQAAIWYFIKLDPNWLTPGYYSYDPNNDNHYGGNPPSQATLAMVADAVANGDGYIPGAGDILAIICLPEEEVQINIIELQIPGEFTGLTPGFWKQTQHFSAWELPYTPTTPLSNVFTNDGTGQSFSGVTLLGALNFPGGPGVAGAERILMRAAVAALLNAASTDVNYPLATGQVISQVNTALSSNNRGTILNLASQLDSYNNLGI